MPTYWEPWPGNTRATAPPSIRPGLDSGDRNLSFHVIPGLADGTQFLRVLVRDLHAVLLFEGHDQFDQVEGVRLQVFGEGGFRRYLLDVNTKLLRDDAPELVETRFGHPSLLSVA